ncbi:hypothetical protein EXIGLDRAFT_389512 [Exidia glandulosa HHB12029]|uniref:Uncharacterized protein n=1 Tax=Exidia glandulosa HHB12029 TaxID=1314781 RepID=A0A165BTA7_EXIGL|nr:hypothetical protein EXIGLDRAFT_389512 [Exidia glandulosa HHB12029]
MTVFFSYFIVFAAALALVSAATIKVPYTDSSISYTGSGWMHDIFELRPGIDPETGGGALDSTCTLGDNSTTTPAFGNAFRFSFRGASVSLVLETRADHGLYNISLDGNVEQHSGYTEAPHCGVVWTSTTLDGTQEHDLIVTFVAKAPESPWDNNYLQLFAIQYDDGPGLAASQSTSTSPSKTPGTSLSDHNGWFSLWLWRFWPSSSCVDDRVKRGSATPSMSSQPRAPS